MTETTAPVIDTPFIPVDCLGCGDQDFIPVECLPGYAIAHTICVTEVEAK